MCKVLEYRYTKCNRPRNAGPDYDEFAPENLCDGRREGILKAPCLIQVCEKHEGGVAQYDIDGSVVSNLKCTPTVEIVYIRSKCRFCGEDSDGHYEVDAEKNNRIMRKPKLIIRTGGDSSFRSMDDYTVHVPQIPWKDPSFRMPDWNPTIPRENAMDDEELVSPFTVKERKPTGIMNRDDEPEEWVDADLRPIDLLENHYDEIGDRPSCRVDRMLYYHPEADDELPQEGLGPQESKPGSQLPQEGGSQPRGPGGESQLNEAQPEDSQGEPCANGSQETSQANALGTGGAEPPPSPPRNPPGCSDSHGRKGRRSSASSEDSAKSSTASPRDRADGPDGAATAPQTLAPQAPALQDSPQDTSPAVGPQAEGDTGNGRRNRPLTDNTSTADFEEKVYAQTEVSGRLLVLQRVQGGTDFAWRWNEDSSVAPFSLAEWETLLNDAVVHDEEEVAGLLETIREDRLEGLRRTAAREELRGHFRFAGYDVLTDEALDQLLERAGWDGRAVYDIWQNISEPIPSVEIDDAPSNPDGNAEQTLAHGDSSSGANGGTSPEVQCTPRRSSGQGTSPSATRTPTPSLDPEILFGRNTGMPAHIQEMMEHELRQRDEEAERQRLQRGRRRKPETGDEDDKFVEMDDVRAEYQADALGGSEVHEQDELEADELRRRRELERLQRIEDENEIERARLKGIRDLIRQERERELLESGKALERELLEETRALRRLAGIYDEEENEGAANDGDQSADDGQQTGDGADEEPPEEEEEEPQPGPRVKRRKANDGRAVPAPPPPVQPRTRPHTRSMGPPTENVHHMRLRPRRGQAASSSASANRTPPPGTSSNPPAAPSRGRGRAGTNRSGGRTEATNTTTTKGKPRSQNGVQKKAKASKKSTTTRRT